MNIPIPILIAIAISACVYCIIIYRCGFVDGSEATHKFGLEEVKRQFEENFWRLEI